MCAPSASASPSAAPNSPPASASTRAPSRTGSKAAEPPTAPPASSSGSSNASLRSSRRRSGTTWCREIATTTRADRPPEYCAKLLDQPDDEIDYSEIPATSAADWQDAEVLLRVSPEEFRAIRKFVRIRRQHEESV